MSAEPPVLESRTPADVYRQALARARASNGLAGWTSGFGPAADHFDRTDVGLVLFKLLGELFQKLSAPLNGAPAKYNLAFWDFLGLTLRAPRAAEAPVAFVPAVDTAFVVPARTQLVAAGAPGVVFETSDDLTVLPVSIVSAMAVRPAADAYLDLTGQIGGKGASFSLFEDDPAQQPLIHALYISDPAFAFAGEIGQLSLTLEGANLYTRYFEDWCNSVGAVQTPEYQVVGYDRLTVTFGDLPDLPPGMVDGVSAPWLRVTPAEGVRIVSFQQRILPVIYSLTFTLTLSGIAPDYAFFGQKPLDLKTGDHPFGATPALQDSFYLASASAFSKPRAQVTLDFEAQPIDPPGAVSLVWEYWAGDAGWQPLQVADTTESLTRSGSVTFTCPEIVQTKINNQLGYWIRARVAAGGYGAPGGPVVTQPAGQVVDGILAPWISDKSAAAAALTKAGLNFGYKYQPATYAPPFVSALKISCVLTRTPQTILAANGFDYAPLGRTPYIPSSETEPTVYLGLDIKNFADEAAGRVLSLFFAPADGGGYPVFLPEPDAPSATPSSPGAASALRLSYLAPDGWRPLRASPGAAGFRAEGVLTLQAPDVFAPAEMFGASLYWLRVEPPTNGAAVPDLIGVFPNVVAAFNAVSHRDVILGSSTGQPSQSLAFPQRPVLEGAAVQVLEPTPFEAAVDDLGDTPAQAQSINSGGGNLPQSWVTWHEVSNFDFSAPHNRHYVLDHDTGVLQFGDGVRGLVPPQGQRNIRAAYYESGGGPAGNLGARAITALRSNNSKVASVTNVLAAAGGVAGDTVAELFGRAPGQFRAQDRAVTSQDFSALALAASQAVRRATCVPGFEGARVCVLPDDPGQTPSPDFDLLTTVQTYLVQRASPLLQGRISVTGPVYARIDVQVNLLSAQGANQGKLTKAVQDAYAAFLNPTTGGVGDGWDFGARVEAAAAANAIQAVPDVAFVDGLTFDADLSAVTLEPDQLPAPGALTIKFLDADAL